jgi:hypothetical protein
MTYTGTRSLLAVAAVLTLAGCAEGPVGSGTARRTASTSWQQPARYEYTLTSSCGETLLFGSFQLTVTDGEVTRAVHLDKEDQSVITKLKLERLPTLNDLLDQYEAAARNGAYLATAEFDPSDGHPTRIGIDGAREVMDDEACYQISDYRPA